MTKDKIMALDFGKVFPLIINKAVKKGRTKEEVYQVTEWLTGYQACDIDAAMEKHIPYGDFFLNAPAPNPAKVLITGAVCGIRVEEIEDPVIKDMRYLDKMVDELAKGRPMEKILRR